MKVMKKQQVKKPANKAMWSRQLKVILWKNFIIRKRHWFLFICEALIPVILFLIVAYGRSKITGLNKQEIVDVTYNEKYPISYESSGLNWGETQIYYSPSDGYYDDIIHRIQEKFQIVNNNIRGFDSQQSLLEAYAKSNNHTVIALVFNSQSRMRFDYTIRYHKQSFSSGTESLYENEWLFSPGIGSKYLWEGYLALQAALDMSFIEKEKESRGERVPAVLFEALEFPYPPHKADSGLSSIFIHYYPLITLCSFIFVCPAVLMRVVEEKYTGIKELMKMVGMKPGILWFGWFVYSIIPMIVSVLIITLILKVDLFDAGYPSIEHTDATVLICFLTLYCMASVAICFFLSTLFYKPTLATLVGLLVWILSYFVPKYIIEDSDSSQSRVSLSTNLVLMLLPNMALHYGYTSMARYEERSIGVQWANLHIPGGGGFNEISMLEVWLMLFFDCVFYMLLALYIDEINPGKYGMPKSFLYPFKSFFEVLKRNHVESCDNTELCDLKETEGIELIGLTKTYAKRNVVDDLSISINPNRITVLLGHNGAGKSTTMGMITGMVKKTSGIIRMNGKPITSRSDITDSVGLCPQHNLFFSDLTVAEHLKFFALLKGMTCTEAERDAEELLRKLNLEDKKNESAQNLSGGMKRKLCLGMAVIGGSKILILDEPSSGMDIQSRRHMWNLLLKWRNERTILITTHFMEEADALADYIVIMDEGKVHADTQGTPFDLKKKFGTGYNLSLMIKKEEDPQDVLEIADNKNSLQIVKKKDPSQNQITKKVDLSQIAKKIHNVLKNLMGDVECKSIDGHEVTFLIPYHNSNNKCQQMFEHLEQNKEKYEIDTIVLSNTTLEDVFLRTRISDVADATINESDQKLELSSMNKDGKGFTLKLRALLYKRYKFTSRKLFNYLIPSLLAFGFLILCIFLSQGSNKPSYSGGPPFKMQLSSYGKTTAFFKDSNDTAGVKMRRIYKGLVAEQKSDFTLVQDISDAIVKEGISNLPFYRHHMIAAAQMSLKEFNSKAHIEAVVMYNNVARHSAPISLNLITNSIAQLLLGEEYSIGFTNHPLNNVNSKTVDQLSEVQIGLLWLIILPLGFLFFLGSFIYFPYVELSTNFTQLQFMCGVPPSVYWIMNFLSDLLVYTAFAMVMAVLSLIWVPFRGLNEFGALLLIMLLYGACGIPCAYLFGRKKSFTGAYALFVILGIMLGVLLSVVVLVLEESGDVSYMKWGDIFRTLFLIFCPQFGLTYSGVAFSRKVINNYNFVHMPRLNLLSVCSREDASPCCFGQGRACDAYKSYMSVLSPQIFLMLLGAIFYLVLNILIHNYQIRKFFNQVRKLCYSLLCCKRSSNIDTDGALGLSNSNFHDRTLTVRRLKKSYSGRQVLNNIGFDLKKGQCMGILGVNGAGKTTTLRMLTREEVLDNGDVHINSTGIDNDEYLNKIGYCPQNDALNFSLSGRDILTTMAMLRGISNRQNVVEYYLKLFELTEVADIPCGFYSGGNKRKLSFAVAIMGMPPFILLDEPTTGVDPTTRRKLWNLIKRIKDVKSNSFMLTSHSMTECEALCNDLQIMRKGTIEKHGSIAKLKQEKNGYTVKLKLQIPTSTEKPQQEDPGIMGNDDVDGMSLKSLNEDITTVDSLKKYLEEKNYEVKDSHLGWLHVYKKDRTIRLSQLFWEFEELKLKTKGFIEDYTVSEASLEDVFLDVANQT